MERVYFIIAVIAFVLSAASLIACAVIFVKMDVVNAVRFLQHKPVQNAKGGNARTRAVRANSRSRNKMSGGILSKIRGSDADTAKITGMESASGKGAADETTERLTAKVSSAAPGLTIVDSESSTGLLEEESERPTGMLAEESENPTGFLQEDSERPTGFLDDESEHPTDALVEETERPTGILEDVAERPTGMLEEAVLGQASGTTEEGLETVFKFVITQSEVVVHTEETIV